MLFRMVYDDKLAEAAYLIGCQKTGEAIVIDPERDIDRYLLLAAKEGVRIVAVAETHIHADFLSGARELAERVGARVYVSDEGDADWKYQWLDKKSGGGAYDHRLLKHNDTFRIGNIEFRTVHTPGHTPEHISFLVTDLGGGATEPMGIATGDFLFVGDLGRPDLLESAAGIVGKADPSAKRLFASVKALDALPDWLQVWPAHGSGSACGKALGAVPQSTIGYERRFNPAVRAATSEGDFVKYILDGQPEPPLYFARMKRDNKVGPRVLGDLPKLKALGAEELKALDAQMAALIDTRSWDAFRKGHVAGSLFHPLNNAFPTDVGSMVKEGEPVYLIIEPAKVDEAVRALVRIGYDDIRGYFEPNVLDRYADSGGTLVSTPEVAAKDAMALVEDPGVFLLDVRRAAEFAGGRIGNASNIAHTRLLSRLAEVPKDKPVLVNCLSGGRSARACALLEKNGYRVTNLGGGITAWNRAHPAVNR